MVDEYGVVGDGVWREDEGWRTVVYGLRGLALVVFGCRGWRWCKANADG
jgi:hypothetical protein